VVIVGAAAITVAAGLKVVDPAPVADLRSATFDSFQRLKPRSYGDPPVRVIDIDEASLSAFGQWPWPRTRIAALVDRLRELGAAAVALDMVLAEPDRTSPASYGEALASERPDLKERLNRALADLPDHDAALAEAMRRAPVVLGFATVGEPTQRQPASKAGYAVAGTNPAHILPPWRGAVASLAVLEEAAAGVGSISLGQDSDSQLIRQAPMVLSGGERLYPGLALEALRVAQGASSIFVRSTGASREAETGTPALVDLRVGQFRVPLTAAGELILHYDRHRPERSVGAAALWNPSREAELRGRIGGHIVFVGASAAGLLDRRITALGEAVPGVTIHAQIAEQIIAQDFLTRPDWAKGLETVVTVMAGAMVAWLLTRVGARYAAAVIGGVSALLVGGAWIAFSEFKLLVDPVYPSLSALAVHFAVTALLYLTTDREKRFIRQAFGTYLAPELLHKLEAAPATLRLGGEIKPMTIMFMDIRGFTPISERLSPEALVDFLNVLFSPLTEAIQRQQGTVDKYIGDSIMAFWNAPVDVPDHARLACAAALEMRDLVDRLNREDAFGFGELGRSDLVVQIGIGLNTGDACVGNMGSERRFNYSVVGDAVNVAARIEGDCKRAGVPILVSEETAWAAEGLAFLEAGRVPLKGKSQSVRLFALVGDEEMAESPEYQALAREHRSMLAAIEAGRQDEALERILACRALAGAPLADFYASFTARLRVPALHGQASLSA
jgi:adenylate cyclase